MLNRVAVDLCTDSSRTTGFAVDAKHCSDKRAVQSAFTAGGTGAKLCSLFLRQAGGNLNLPKNFLY